MKSFLTIKEARGNFFSSQAVIKAVDAATRRVLSRFGSYVRQRARSSIKKAPKIDASTGAKLRGRRRTGQRVEDAASQPGRSPYGHGSQVLKRFIFFAYDPGRKSVVIGPARVGGTVDSDSLPALEYGGPSTIESRRGGPRRRIRIEARPFMGPAFDEEVRRLPPNWRDSVK